MANNNKPKKPKLDSDAIESIGVDKISSFFSRSQVIKPVLQKQDRGPFWDGFLYFYKNKQRINENYIGSIRVQSKGLTKAVFSKKQFSYPIRRKDLEAYRKEGTLYFVTQITETGSKLYYRELTPGLISNILRAHIGDANPSVLMYPVPDNLTEVENRLLVFKKDCEIQLLSTAQDSKSFSFDDVISKGIKQFSVVIPSDVVNKGYVDEYLSSNSVYLYANVDPEHNLKVLVGDTPVRIHIRQTINAKVSIAGKVYYDSFDYEASEEEIKCYVGKSMTFVFPRKPGSTKASMNYHQEIHYLKDAIFETEMINSLLTNRCICLGDLNLTFERKQKHAIFDDKLPKWKELDSVLDSLSVNKPLNIRDLSKEDSSKLGLLIDCIGRHKKVKLTGIETGMMYFCVSNLCLLIWCYKDAQGECSFINIYDILLYSFAAVDVQRLPASVFSAFTVENWERTDNIDYNLQLDSYKRLVVNNPYIYAMANKDCLNMMLAMDGLEESDKDKFKALSRNVHDILSWLRDNDKENTTAFNLNLLQLSKRTNALTNEEQRLALSIIAAENSSAIDVAEAALILDDDQLCLEKLRKCSPEQCHIFSEDSASRWFTEPIRQFLSCVPVNQ